MFAFVHTADWQIGRPFRSFGDRVGALLEEARLDAIETIAGAAAAAYARHVLVAGDLFDAETLPAKSVMPALDRMGRNKATVWHVIPGNHDPGRPGGLWQRLRASGLPSNVNLYLDSGVHEIEPGICLLVAPVIGKGRRADPTAWMDAAATPPGTLRVGLAHGSIYDFTRSDDEGETIIDPRRAEKARLGYLALGDWHGTKQISASTWYSGTPEPDRFGDDESGHALVVRLNGATAPVVEPVRTGRYVWKEHVAEIQQAPDLAVLERAILDMAPAPERLLLRLRLRGALDIEARAGLPAWQETMAARIRHIEIDTSGLIARASGAELSRVLTDTSLITVADRLRKRAETTEPADRRVAEDALLRLLEIAGSASTEDA